MKLLKSVTLLFFLLSVTMNASANLISLNQSNYLELGFSIHSDSGVFDTDINRLNIFMDYAPETWANWGFNEVVEIYNGDDLLASNGPTWSDDTFNFASIHDGTIDGKIKVYSWYENDPLKNVSYTNFFSSALDVCNNAGCSYADNSYLVFNDYQVKSSTEVPEPGTFAILLPALLLLTIRLKK